MQQVGAFSHDGHSKVVALCVKFAGKTSAIIINANPHLLCGIQLHLDPTVGCVCMLHHIRDGLKQYLDSGERKLQKWFSQHKLVQVDFSDRPEIFVNINTPEELQALTRSKPM